MKSNDKDRTDEKLWNYVHITRDKRLGLTDTKVGGNITVSKNAFIDSVVANKIGIDSSGNDVSGFGQFTDLSSNSLNVFGDTNIYGTLNVNSIFKRTITEVDIDISGNLELYHDLDVSGVITAIGGIDLIGIGNKDKINNVTIGHDVSGMAKFTDLSTNNLDSINLNSLNIGLDASGYGGFNNLVASTLTSYDNLIIGNETLNPYLTSRGDKSISLVTNSGTNSSEVKINPGQNQDIQMIPNGTGKLSIGNGTNRGYITTNQIQNLLIDTNSGTTTGFMKIISGSNGNIQFAPNGSGTILIGNGINHQVITTSGAKNLTLNTTNNTNTPSVVINAGTVGNIDLKHNTVGMIIVGNSSVSGKITTNGQQDLLLSTYSNNATSSKINIKNDISGNIQLLPSGNGGKVEVGNGTTIGQITTNGTYDLKLTTNNDIDSGFIKIEDGLNGNIEITPQGIGNIILGGSIDFPGHDGSNGLKLNGILVTSDANEINRLDGSAPGTIVPVKVPVYDSIGNLNMKRLILDGITVNLTANELNVLDGSLQGIVVNNKAVIYSDAGKINATQYQLSGVSITSSASEINYLDGSSPENISNNRVVVYGPNGEINLSILQLNGTQLYVGNEFSFLQGATSGSIVNSKAVIYSSTGDITATKLITGSGGASAEITSNGSYDLTLKTGNNITGIIKINNGTNGNIEILPNGTGKIISTNNFTTNGGVNLTGTISMNSLLYPSSDGTSNQVLKTDGAGNLSFLSLTLDNIIDLKTDTNSIFIGCEPSSLDTTTNNTSLGVNSLLNLTTGTNNTSIGYNSLNKNESGDSNISIGSQSLETLTTGYNNIVLGEKCGSLITTGSSNIIIGNSSEPSLLNSINEIIIGNNTIGHGNNIAVIGNDSTTSIDPSSDNSVDLGSTAFSYKNLFINGSITLNGYDYLSNITNSTITNSDIIVGTGKIIDIENSTLFTSNSQNANIVESVGQDIDIGPYNITAKSFISDIATGTAPFTVTSTTQVSNLFATKAQTLDSSPSTTIYSTGVENVMSSGDISISNGKLEHTFTIPAGSIITDIFGVFSTSLSVDAGIPNIKIGSESNDSQYLSVISLIGHESRGFNFNGTMGLATPINTNYFSSQSNIIITILSEGGNLTNGVLKLYLKFVI